VFLLRLSARVASTRDLRSFWLPLVVFPDFRFPELSWLPGATPVQWTVEVKRFISVPVSVNICLAVRLPTPGIVSSRSQVFFKRVYAPLDFFAQFLNQRISSSMCRNWVFSMSF
jgi:hypothetical protein